MNKKTAGAVTAEAWRLWNPGLDNDELTLGEVYATLPGVPADKIHFLVRLIENPASPIAFAGAASLLHHDCLHVLLGRGLLNQDEAFVIGFTMGTSSRLSPAEVWAFKLIARRLYPDGYRMDEKDVRAYELGLRFAKRRGARDINLFPFETAMDRRIGELRRSLGLGVADMRAAYRLEQALIPNTAASGRLATKTGSQGKRLAA